jgi:hypothetical protein
MSMLASTTVQDHMATTSSLRFSGFLCIAGIALVALIAAKQQQKRASYREISDTSSCEV